MRSFVFFALVFITTLHANAQSVNVEIAPPGQVPSPAYGAAGTPGVWNSVNTASNQFTFNLVDVNGNTTGVYYKQIGGTELVSTDDPATSGNDDALLDDFLITHNAVETCHFVYGLENGIYELLLYSWMPNRPDVMGYNSADQEPPFHPPNVTPHLIVGGAWTGQHVEGVTFTRHICFVTEGNLWAHSGIVPGHSFADGAAANGFQIRKLPPQAPGDLNCDGTVNGDDIGGFVQAISNSPAYAVGNPTCNVTNADMNGDFFRNEQDIPGFVAALLG